MSQYINEAFKKFRLLEDFEEFPLNPEGLDNLGSFMGQALDDESVDVYDLEAEAQEDLKKSYVGKVICDCNVCHSNIFYDKEDIVIDDDGIVNAEDECPYCMSTDGYTIIGEIKEWAPGVEDEIEDELSDEELADEPIEIEDEEDTEVVKESLKRKSRKRKLTESRKKKLNEDTWLTDVGIEDVKQVLNEYGKIKNIKFYDNTIEVTWTKPIIKNFDIIHAMESDLEWATDSIIFCDEAGYDYAIFTMDEEDFDESLKLDGVKSLRGTKGLRRRPEKAGVKSLRAREEKSGVEELTEGMSQKEAATKRAILNELKKQGYDDVAKAFKTLDLKINDEANSDLIHLEDDGTLTIPDNAKKEIVDAVVQKLTKKSVQRKLKKRNMDESIEDVTVTTEDETMTMTTKEDGGVVVETSPKEAEDEFYDDFDMDSDVEAGDEVIAPISDETEDEIMGNSEEDDFSDEELFGDEFSEEETPEEETPKEEDVEVGEFDEETFDGLGESYLRRCYDNVNGYKTTQVRANNNTLIIEGVISFKSGSKKKTNFVFESKDAKNGKYIFEGYNAQINNGKPVFKLNCSIKNKTIIPTSFKYNYTSKNALNESIKLSGTVKVKRK